MQGLWGNFHVAISVRRRGCGESKCTGCGLGTEKVPQKKVPNEFNWAWTTPGHTSPLPRRCRRVAADRPQLLTTMLKTGKSRLLQGLYRRGQFDYTQRG